METEDHEIEVIFSRLDPSDFEFEPANIAYCAPCFVAVFKTFTAVTEQAKAFCRGPKMFELKVDILSKVARSEQLHYSLYRHCRSLRKTSSPWADYLWAQRDDFETALLEKSSSLPICVQLANRSLYRKVSLEQILREPPETMEIYIAEDMDSSENKIYTLRIHSSLYSTSSEQGYLWFQKTVPWKIQSEDIIPWLQSTVCRLKKAAQPNNFNTWANNLLRHHPEFSLPSKSNDGRWAGKPVLILVFGTSNDIGYAAHFRLERERIHQLIREGEKIEIRASIASDYESPDKQNWNFYIFTKSTDHAQQLELALLSGDQVHFCIGQQISGIIALHNEYVNFINVDRDTIKRLCARDGMFLGSHDYPRFKHKLFIYYPISLSREGFLDVLE